MKYESKEKIAVISLLALGVAFETLSRTCPELQKEISDWDDGLTLAMGVLEDGPSISLKKENGQITYLGKGIKDADLVVYFKNIDSALMVFVGLMGSHTAAVQRRTIIHGNIGKSVQFVRAMNVVQKYLMPGPVLKKNFKRPPSFSFKEGLLKARIYATLAPGMIAASSR